MTDIRTIAEELNAKSYAYQIGRLKTFAKSSKGLLDAQEAQYSVSKTIFPKYAFHHGGRSELQFNIGFDRSDGEALRHGIAFSFETNQTLPDIDALRPQVRLFNEFLDLYPHKYSRMRMWHWDAQGRSDDYMPSAIPKQRIVNHVFVFLGLRYPSQKVARS